MREFDRYANWNKDPFPKPPFYKSEELGPDKRYGRKSDLLGREEIQGLLDKRGDNPRGSKPSLQEFFLMIARLNRQSHETTVPVSASVTLADGRVLRYGFGEIKGTPRKGIILSPRTQSDDLSFLTRDFKK